MSFHKKIRGPLTVIILCLLTMSIRAYAIDSPGGDTSTGLIPSSEETGWGTVGQWFNTAVDQGAEILEGLPEETITIPFTGGSDADSPQASGLFNETLDVNENIQTRIENLNTLSGRIDECTPQTENTWITNLGNILNTDDSLLVQAGENAVDLKKTALDLLTKIIPDNQQIYAREQKGVFYGASTTIRAAGANTIAAAINSLATATDHTRDVDLFKELTGAVTKVYEQSNGIKPGTISIEFSQDPAKAQSLSALSEQIDRTLNSEARDILGVENLFNPKLSIGDFFTKVDFGKTPVQNSFVDSHDINSGNDPYKIAQIINDPYGQLDQSEKNEWKSFFNEEPGQFFNAVFNQITISKFLDTQGVSIAAFGKNNDVTDIDYADLADTQKQAWKDLFNKDPEPFFNAIFNRYCDDTQNFIQQGIKSANEGNGAYLKTADLLSRALSLSPDETIVFYDWHSSVGEKYEMTAYKAFTKNDNFVINGERRTYSLPILHGRARPGNIDKIKNALGF